MARRDHAKKPLYRKVNTKARGVHHAKGGDYRDRRTADRRQAAADSASARSGMGKRTNRGLDYTPLFRFLQSRVGQPWAPTRAEAVSRLDRPDPIAWLVAEGPEDAQPYVRMGESSYWGGLKVDADGVLRRVDPSLGPSSLEPSCACCTHTFDGVPFTRRFRPPSAD